VLPTVHVAIESPFLDVVRGAAGVPPACAPAFSTEAAQSPGRPVYWSSVAEYSSLHAGPRRLTRYLGPTSGLTEVRDRPSLATAYWRTLRVLFR
jgi:hypothetical protein